MSDDLTSIRYEYDRDKVMVHFWWKPKTDDFGAFLDICWWPIAVAVVGLGRSLYFTFALITMINILWFFVVVIQTVVVVHSNAGPRKHQYNNNWCQERKVGRNVSGDVSIWDLHGWDKGTWNLHSPRYTCPLHMVFCSEISVHWNSWQNAGHRGAHSIYKHVRFCLEKYDSISDELGSVPEMANWMLSLL